MSEPKVALVDSHCHIDMPEFDQDRDMVLERARAAGVERLLIVGELDERLGLAGLTRAVAIAEKAGFPCSGGVHPHQARFFDERAADELRGLARERRISAIGEIGLDFHYDYSPRDVQRQAFRQQIRLAREVGLPVIIHTRKADAETAAILETEGAHDCGGVIHCFTGGEELAQRALALGFFISFSGIAAFPRSETIQQVARATPLDRLLVETDAPFLAPPPHRGKRNEPAFVVEVVRHVAALRGISLDTLGTAVCANFDRLREPRED